MRLRIISANTKKSNNRKQDLRVLDELTPEKQT